MGWLKKQIILKFKNKKSKQNYFLTCKFYLKGEGGESWECCGDVRHKSTCYATRRDFWYEVETAKKKLKQQQKMPLKRVRAAEG